MNKLTLIADLLILQGRNQWALAAAIAELNKWVAQRGSLEVSKNVQEALAMLDESLLPLSRGVARLIEEAEREDGIVEANSNLPR
ncbi:MULTISPECIES: hypothetical protein [unclassified Pseudomonas]|uniref:hypothetical protein n=1 Tax=unclassified Pseudomonas TaxID=196821 RepID=UPI001032BF43|nr:MULTISPECIES: hypothetical protein [unclassified Pseudomonas]